MNRLSRRSRAGLCGIALALVHPLGVGGLQEAPDMEGLLRGRIEALRTGLEAGAAGERLLARIALPLFYEERGFEPGWVHHAARAALLSDLTGSIRAAAAHGLDPADYHLGSIERLSAARAPDEADLADLDLLASDAFLMLASHLLHGRIDPETIDPEWIANRRSSDFHRVLADALAGSNVSAALEALAPAQSRYQAMIGAAADLRAIAAHGGWPQVAMGPRLELGNEGPRVDALRARLRASGDLSEASGEGTEFDEALGAAVRRFQARHGLDVDGVVGAATLVALNIPATERARQIEVNLERWRWLPADLGERHIEVNIAGFEAKVVERGRTVRVHRAIVGREFRQTPSFTGVMTYLVLSPYWHVPPTIAAVDKLPVIRQDPGAIAAQRMTLLDQRTNEPVDPSGVDWSAMVGSEFNRRYRLRQDPGPSNALGSVKFMFPNRHNVYLHDTPSRELFARTARSFSSGCIRIQDALDLAEYLLSDQPEWTRERIEQVVAAGVERTVRLTQGVPVHLLYWTAWADPDGTIQFRDDIYGRDGPIRRGLDASPPGV